MTTNRKERTMRPSTRRFSRGRITGLTLIAVLTLGLGYLHFAGSSTAVSVPAGAHAGQLTLKNCTYNTEKGAYAADCGTLVVPENRADPHSRLIALPVIRIRAHSTHPGAPIFRLQGGPGITNMVFPDASRFTAKHDVVLVGYRGVDGSTRLDCPEVSSATPRTEDSSRPNLPGRIGRWSAAHWKTATFGWLALVLVAFAVGGQVGTKQADPTNAGPGEAGRMGRILDAGV
ncbi:MAG: hypothetical protein ACHQCG_09530, partial [Solirubrobacterales bacterium]